MHFKHVETFKMLGGCSDLGKDWVKKCHLSIKVSILHLHNINNLLKTRGYFLLIAIV